MLNELKYAEGSVKKTKRVGRGQGTGQGCTSGKGNKGQKARSGYSRKFGFEGGQMPMHRRIPKRGFKNKFRVEYRPVNLQQLAEIDSLQELTIDYYFLNGLAGKNDLVKILSVGEVKKAIKIEAHAFSEKAIEKIKNAGGEAVLV